MKSSFILHLDSLCILDKMTDEQAGRFIKIIYQYQKTKELPEMDILMEMAITPFINQFFRDEKGYERVVERNRKNGEKGGRPTKEPKKPSGLNKTQDNPENPDEPKKADSDNDSVSDSDNGSKKEKYSFDRFWDLYDKKVGSKDRLKKKYDSLHEEDKEAIFEHIPKYKSAQPDKQYRKDPATYLNNQSWKDEIIQRTSTPIVKISSYQEQLQKAANWQKGDRDEW